MAQVKDNLAVIETKIADACKRADRERSSLCVLAVTKTQPNARIVECAEAGLKVFAESRIQEAKAKIAELADLGQWHLIGHLQTNKVKPALELFSCVESVDSMHLAEALSAAALRCGKKLPCFAEVNVAAEAQKHGLPLVGAYDAIQRMAQLPGLDLKGLMAMAPYSDDAESSRPVFAELKALALRLEAPLGKLELSMGMSKDYAVAVEEGATLVRIGSALFL